MRPSAGSPEGAGDRPGDGPLYGHLERPTFDDGWEYYLARGEDVRSLRIARRRNGSHQSLVGEAWVDDQSLRGRLGEGSDLQPVGREEAEAAAARAGYVTIVDRDHSDETDAFAPGDLAVGHLNSAQYQRIMAEGAGLLSDALWFRDEVLRWRRFLLVANDWRHCQACDFWTNREASEPCLNCGAPSG